MPALPNLLVIGAQKAGTSSLHRYLDDHPQVQMSQPKELNFFSWTWDRGLDWYGRFFDAEAQVRGESSPSYSFYPYAADVPERIHSVVPDMKLVYLVRDPIERMISQYLHLAGRGYERRPIDEVFTGPRFLESHYMVRSSYGMQLQRYLTQFPESQIVVLADEDLRGDREATLRRLFGFLRVDDSFVSPGWSRAHNPSLDYPLQRAAGRVLSRKAVKRAFRWRWVGRLNHKLARPFERPHLDPSLRERLAEALRDDVQLLRELTGRRFESWPV